MSSESGIAVILVMRLLVVLSLLGIGVISQTTWNTKFSDAAGTLYIGLRYAQAKLATKGPITRLVLAKGNRPSDNSLVSVLYAAPKPAIGGTSHGTVVGNVWYPGYCGIF